MTYLYKYRTIGWYNSRGKNSWIELRYVSGVGGKCIIFHPKNNFRQKVHDLIQIQYPYAFVTDIVFELYFRTSSPIENHHFNYGRDSYNENDTSRWVNEIKIDKIILREDCKKSDMGLHIHLTTKQMYEKGIL